MTHPAVLARVMVGFLSRHAVADNRTGS
jgi:hypothetical protein